MRREVTEFYQALQVISRLIDMVDHSPLNPDKPKLKLRIELPSRQMYFDLHDMLMHDMLPYMITETIPTHPIPADHFEFAGWLFTWRGR